MRITERHTTVMRDELIRFDDGEVRPVRYSRDGKQYRADMVQLVWMSRDEEDTWTLTATRVHGQVLRKDGTDSKNRTDERFYATDPTPDWLRELIDDTDPTKDGAA